MTASTGVSGERAPTAGPAAPPAGPCRARRRGWVPLLVTLLLTQMAAVMVWTAVRQTPTIDEPVYVGTAVVQLREHSLRFNPEHPPLGKLVVGVGALLAGPRLEPGFRGDQGVLGRRLLYESGNDPWRLMLWARLPVIALTLLFGLVVYAFARELAGTGAGLVALALYVFSPDLVAHGSLATLDVPAAGFVLTSVWLLWRARHGRSWCLPLAGVALGAALATKMSTLPAVPVLLVPAARAGLRAVSGGNSRRARARAFAYAGVVAVAAVAVVWAAYLLVDPRLRWAPRQPVPDVAGLRGLLVQLLPFPEPYRDGMRVQFGLEDASWQGFLFGRLYTGSRWYYMPAALLVKTPLGALALWAAGTVAVVAVRRLRPAAPYLLAAPAVLLAAAMLGTRNLGTRYALFLPMFLAVAAGCVLVTAAHRHRPAVPSATGARAVPVVTGARAVPVVTGALVAFAAVSSLRTFPFYLPYSNEAFGGPAKTRLRLHDSNVDWGQDLGRLAERLREHHRGEHVWLVYKGSGVPSFYGIHASDPRKMPARQVRGLLVVSDSAAARATGRLAALIASSRPVGDVGHSITIYRR